MNKNLFSILLFVLAISANSFSQTIIPKQVGIGFRWDDNSSIEKYSSYFAIFNKYGVKSGLGLNFGNDPMGPAPNAYVDSLRKYQQQGHELMDHTPNHRTNFFITRYDASGYIGLPGAAYVRSGNKICVEFATPVTSNSITSGYCDISRNIITAPVGSFNPGSTDANTGYYLYFPSQPNNPPNSPNLVLMDLVVTQSGSSTVRVTDVWNDPVDLGTQTNVQYYLFSAAGVRLTIDGLRLLANETLKLADSYNLQRPTTWIQPGMAFVANTVTTQNLIFPTLNRADLKAALAPLGYTAGATYSHAFQQEAVLAFNEFDPNQDAQFGMQWNILRDEGYDLEGMKFLIANYMSLNKALLGGGHGNPIIGPSGDINAPVRWQMYLTKMDNLLAWCQQKNIPVKTYKQWADILYNKVYDNTTLPDPYQNVFPKLNVDLNENNFPDGYNTNNFGNTPPPDVTYITNDGAPSSGGKSFQIAATGGWEIFHADNTHFSSFEKGLNDFEIWLKGGPSSQFTVEFHLYENDGTDVYTNIQLYLDFKTTPYWRRFTLNDFSLSPEEFIPVTLDIPNNIQSAQVIVIPQGRGGSVSVSTIKLQKKGASLNLTTMLEGAYNTTTNLMSNNLKTLNLVPTYQPYAATPWNFNGDTLITNALGIPSNSVDWVLVELRDKNNPSTIVSRKAGLIRQNGSIIDPTGSPLTFQVPSDQYYISVRHRNHLMIRSTNPVSLTAGATANYNFTTAGNSVGGKQIDTSPVVWGMIAGDVNGNGQIQNNDNEDFIDLQIGQTGYRSADINMDGIVDANDNTLWHQNNGLGEQ